MKNLFGAAALGVAMTFAGAALANDTLEATFGNTVSGALGDGTVIVSYLMNADNTFSVVSAEGTVDGTWHVMGDQICLAAGDAEAVCSDLVDGLGIGGSWTATDATSGAEITYTIVEGR